MNRWRLIGSWIVGLWWRLLVPVANFLVATAIAVVAAVLGLVVGDLLPLTGHRQFSGARWGALALTLIVLFAVILWRGTVYRSTGTLFYIRMLDHSMVDWHTTAVKLALRRRMSLRSVTPWTDLAARTHDGITDLVEPCARVTSALHTAVSCDRDDTASTIAPNMPWPVSLAIGTELPDIGGLRLLELDGPVSASGAFATEISFALPVTPPPPGLAARELTVESHTMPHPSPGSTRVGLLLAFTEKARRIDAEQIFAPFGVGTYHVVLPTWVSPDRHELVPGCLNKAHFETLAQVLPEAVADIKQQAGANELVVAATLPKTLALALGWGLAQRGCRFFAGTHLLFFNGDGRPYQPVRTCPSQPSTAPGPNPG
jgi:hypothetical protein